MPNPKFLKSRRSFLKGAAYTYALSIGGMSGFAFANSNNSSSLSEGFCQTKGLTGSNISIMQQQMLDKEVVTLFNHSDSPVLLDAHTPIHLEQFNGSLVVKVNQVDSDTFCGLVQISPRERITFDITTLRADFTNSDIFPIPTLAGNNVLLSSDHGAFNKLVAVS